MGTVRGGSIERAEPTFGNADLIAVAQHADEIVTRAEAAYEWRQGSEERRQAETRTAYTKLALWVLVWCGMVWLCQAAAQALQPRNPDGLMYLLGALGTAVMLLVTFWRTVWRIVWWFIGLVIVLAVIKGAFLIVFAL